MSVKATAASTDTNRETRAVEQNSASTGRDAETSRVAQTAISRDSEREIAKVEFSPPGSGEKIFVQTATAAVTIGAAEYIGRVGAVAAGQTVREFVIEPTARAVFSEKTTTYTDGSKSIDDFPGSREYDSQGRITEGSDRFGASFEVSNNTGNQTTTLYEEYGTITHISDLSREGFSGKNSIDSGGSDGDPAEGGGDCVMS